LRHLLGAYCRDSELLRRALTHSSAGAGHNERLEYLGDALLGFIIAELLFTREPEAGEGRLTRLRSRLVSGATLARLARSFGLDEALRVGPGLAGQVLSDTILAGAMEALIAAVYLEAGLPACRQLLDRLYAAEWVAGDARAPDEAMAKDAKSCLQEWMQARSLPLPSYQVVDTCGQPHRRLFTVACSVAPLPRPATASATTKREAEQRAADATLQRLQALEG